MAPTVIAYRALDQWYLQHCQAEYKDSKFPRLLKIFVHQVKGGKGVRLFPSFPKRSVREKFQILNEIWPKTKSYTSYLSILLKTVFYLEFIFILPPPLSTRCSRLRKLVKEIYMKNILISIKTKSTNSLRSCRKQRKKHGIKTKCIK